MWATFIVPPQTQPCEGRMASRRQDQNVRKVINAVAVAHGVDPRALWDALREHEPTEEVPSNGSILAFACAEGATELRLPAPRRLAEGAMLLDWQRRFLGQTFAMMGVIELSDATKVDNLPVVVVERPGENFVEHVGQNGLLTGVELMALARQLGATIEELHRRGLHHLDIRPGNLVRGRRGWVLDHPRPVPIAECGWGSEGDLPAFRDVWGCASILTFAATGRTVVDTETMSDEVRHVIEAMPLGNDLAGFRDQLLLRVADARRAERRGA